MSCFLVFFSDQIVKENEGGNPCHEGRAETAPMGSFTCNPNVSLCIEKWEGPNSGITSFDNIGLAMLTVFQVRKLLFCYIMAIYVNWANTYFHFSPFVWNSKSVNNNFPYLLWFRVKNLQFLVWFHVKWLKLLESGVNRISHFSTEVNCYSVKY